MNLDALLFVDTNVLLDFYRIRNTDISTKYLEQLEACKERLILGSQIEMEYKKNRQAVIIESLENFRTDWSRLTAPALVSEHQAVQMIDKKKKELDVQKKKVDAKIKRVLSDPVHHDRVYQCLHRLFKHESPFNLTRNSKDRFAIRNMARKRFVLGYPPRKRSDVSIGDAVNWEWIVRCCQESGKHVVIVSRDNDFGCSHAKKYYLNDWLKQEFSERVSKRRKVMLTDKLSLGLKIVHAAVTKEMERAEEELLSEVVHDPNEKTT